jgi:recombination protein RecT
MSTEIATQSQPVKPAQQFAAQLDARRESFAGLLPSHVGFEKFKSTLVTAVSMEPSLLQADRASLFTSCMQAAADGLLPNKREAALVVYMSKGVSRVQYMPMVAGVLKKLRQSGEISTFTSQCVYEHDFFELEYGTETKLRHIPKLNGDRGALLCVYAICKLKDGTSSFEAMSLEQIDRRRAVSKSKAGPWVDWYDEMARKTVIRKLCQYLPSSTDIDRLIEHIDQDVDLAAKPTPSLMGDVPDVEEAQPASADGEVIEQ